MSRMSMIAKNLADLTAAVGAQNIAHLPNVEGVEVVAQSEDEDAFAYRIFYGIGRGTTEKPEVNKVWIYLVTYSNRPHELKFVVYHNDDASSIPGVFDGQYAARIVEELSGPSIAFGNITKNRKIQSLAKYYFLALMRHKGSQDDELKAPFSITKTWVEELKAVCLDFAPHQMARLYASGSISRKGARHRSSVMSPVPGHTCPTFRRNRSERVTDHMDDTQEREKSRASSTLSDPPAGLLDNAGEEQQLGAICLRIRGSAAITSLRSATPDLTRPDITLDRARRHMKAASPAASLISMQASSITISATPNVTRTRDQNIHMFNCIRTRELSLGQDKHSVHEKKTEHMKAMKKLQNDIALLDQKEAMLDKTCEDIKRRKRDLMGSMSYDEQLDFMYEAGLAAASKRLRLD